MNFAAQREKTLLSQLCPLFKSTLAAGVKAGQTAFRELSALWFDLHLPINWEWN